MPSDKVLIFNKNKKRQGKKPKTPPISKREAQTTINTLARDSYNVFIPPLEHAEQRKDYRDFTDSDIIEILRDGIIREDPRWEKGEWKYKLEVVGFRGRIGAAVVTMIMKQKTELRVVTVMWLDRRW